MQVIAFAGVLCAGLLIGWVFFGRADSPSAPVTQGSAAAPKQAPVDFATRLYPRLGLTLGLPEGWRTSFRRGVLNAAAGDQSVSVAISAAGGADAGAAVRGSDRKQLKRLFKAREITRQRGTVGSASTVVTELVGTTSKQQRIRILSMGPSSRWRTYSIQVFSVLQPAARRLQELRTLLDSLQYRKPR